MSLDSLDESSSELSYDVSPLDVVFVDDSLEVVSESSPELSVVSVEFDEVEVDDSLLSVEFVSVLPSFSVPLLSSVSREAKPSLSCKSSRPVLKWC